MDKFTSGAPIKQADIRIRESKNNQVLEKYMHRNSQKLTTSSQQQAPHNIQPTSSSALQIADANTDALKFGLPSLRSPELPVNQKKKQRAQPVFPPAQQ